MILHVYEAAQKSEVGEVYVASPDQKIIEVIKNSGGKAIQTSIDHQTGTDRVFEYLRYFKKCTSVIVNLQGDMPNIKPEVIKDLIIYMEYGKCDIGTLASEFKSNDEIDDKNVVKV